AYLSVYLFTMAAVDQWRRVPGAGGGGQCRQERFRDRLVDVYPLHGDTDLPGVGEGAECGLFRGPAGVDIGVDEERIVTAVLQQYVRAGRGRAAGDRPARGSAADVGDEVHILVCGQGGADGAVALQRLEHAVR